MASLLGFIFFFVFFGNDENENKIRYYENYPSAVSFDTTFLVIKDNINVRLDSSISSDILDSLPIGTEVKILFPTYNIINIKGKNLPLVRVSYSKNGDQYQGYIWFGFLTSDYCEFSNNIIFTYISEIINKDENHSLFYHVTSLLDKNKLLRTINIDTLETDVEFYTYMEIKKNPTSSIDYEIDVDGTFEACCSSYFRNTFLVKNNSVYKLPRLDWYDACGDGVYNEYLYSNQNDKINYIIMEGTYNYILDTDIPTITWKSKPDSKGTLNLKKLFVLNLD